MITTIANTKASGYVAAAKECGFDMATVSDDELLDVLMQVFEVMERVHKLYGPAARSTACWRAMNADYRAIRRILNSRI